MKKGAVGLTEKKKRIEEDEARWKKEMYTQKRAGRWPSHATHVSTGMKIPHRYFVDSLE